MSQSKLLGFRVCLLPLNQPLLIFVFRSFLQQDSLFAANLFCEKTETLKHENTTTSIGDKEATKGRLTILLATFTGEIADRVTNDEVFYSFVGCWPNAFPLLAISRNHWYPLFSRPGHLPVYHFISFVLSSLQVHSRIQCHLRGEE